MSDTKIMDRVRKLLAIADHPNTGEHERAVAMMQANSLMQKHAIEEATARASEGPRKSDPIETRVIRLLSDDDRVRSDMWSSMRTIFGVIADGNRCKVVYTSSIQASIFGQTSDITWTELLFTSILSEFIATVNPVWSSARSYDANVYAFKVVGYKWEDINRIAMDNGAKDGRVWEKRQGAINAETRLPRYYYGESRAVQILRENPDSGTVFGEYEIPTKKFHSMFGAYKREAKRRGESDLVASSNPAEYRRQFTRAFADQIIRRLVNMYELLKEESKGSEVVLANLEDRVNEAVYEAFPDLSPEASLQRQEESRARRIREEQERQEMLNKMTPAQRQKFLEKEERQRRADYKRWSKTNQVAVDFTAQKMGKEAANKINISRAEKVHDQQRTPVER